MPPKMAPMGEKASKIRFTPYIKGEVTRIANAGTLTGIVLGIIFVLMPLAFMVGTNRGSDVEILFVAVWFLALIATLFAEAKIRPNVKPGVVQAYAVCLSLIGVPGLIISNRANVLSVMEIAAYVGILAMRMAVLFIMLPRSILESRYPPALLIIRSLLAGALFTSVISIILYASRGFNIFVSTRGSFDDWLHPNFTAQLGALCCLLVIIDPKMRLLWKFLIGGVGLYCMILTQGRSSLFSTIIILVLLFIFELLNDPKKYSVRAVGYIVGLGVFGTLLTPLILQLPAIQNIIARTEATDPFAGREKFIQAALDAWRESQIFGYGWRSGVLDNFYAVMLLQTGLVGLAIYLIFFLLIAFKGFKLFRSQGTHTRLLGKFVLIMCMSYFIRSFTEGLHILALTDLPGNALCLAVGVAFMITPGKSKWDDQLVPMPLLK